MDFLTLAKERYSCRKFSDKPVEKEKIQQILSVAQIAPTAKNIQPQINLIPTHHPTISPNLDIFPFLRYNIIKYTKYKEIKLI